MFVRVHVGVGMRFTVGMNVPMGMQEIGLFQQRSLAAEFPSGVPAATRRPV